MEYLSNIELYFTSSVSEDEKYFILIDEEFHHCTKVMRNKIGEELFATNGNGKIFKGRIDSINKSELKAQILKVYQYKNKLARFTFCIPNIKNPERLKFAIEKCVELGITDFIFFQADHSINKKFNLERIEKIILSSLKQSLRSFLPKISFSKSVKDLLLRKDEIVVFDQSSDLIISKYTFSESKSYSFVFGPEGGFSESEFAFLNESIRLRLTDNRLRTETAIIMTASLIS